ncbi:hypothetical protein N7532_001614 [Penicillium argentinense]|uniref:WSC domain-containing protein n=1 Tax=Penicillium argentinense TaxID=1131581 RepID=A0A9W9G2U6_9EURO|nr:uncharacterized protein N7532_001614 [Penicillium argentinense]KAJ5111079.1 hypothetical protein N7532_001614 [Penicillium argentinense]
MYPQPILAVCALALPAFASLAKETIGCYSKVNSPTAQSEFEFMSLEYCTNKCSRLGYRISALSDGSQCSCGNELPSESDKVDDDKCDTPCQGFPADMCGGDHLFTVLTTAEYSAADSSSNLSSSSEPNPNTSGSGSGSDEIVTMTKAIPSTAGGGIVVAPTNIDESNLPTGILTAPASMVSKASTVIATAKVTSAPAIATASTSSTPSSTPNAANTLRAGHVAGVLVAGLGLLL